MRGLSRFGDVSVLICLERKKKQMKDSKTYFAPIKYILIKGFYSDLRLFRILVVRSNIWISSLRYRESYTSFSSFHLLLLPSSFIFYPCIHASDSWERGLPTSEKRTCVSSNDDTGLNLSVIGKGKDLENREKKTERYRNARYSFLRNKREVGRSIQFDPLNY